MSGSTRLVVCYCHRREGVWLSVVASGGKVSETVSGRARVDWAVAIRRKRLMENPHYETGSQEEVTIYSVESLVPLQVYNF